MKVLTLVLVREAEVFGLDTEDPAFYKLSLLTSLLQYISRALADTYRIYIRYFCSKMSDIFDIFNIFNFY